MDNSNTKTKTIVVIRKKKRKSDRIGVGTAAIGRIGQKKRYRSFDAVDSGTLERAQDVTSRLESGCDNLEHCDNLFLSSAVQNGLLSDTLCMIQSLQSQSLSIPIPLCSDSNKESIFGIMECQLYKSGLCHKTVSREIAELLHNNKIRKLLLPTSNFAVANDEVSNYQSSCDVPPPIIYITTEDYCRAAYHAHDRSCNTEEFSLSGQKNSFTLASKNFAINWFQRNLRFWNMEKILKSDFERVWVDHEKHEALDRNAGPLNDTLEYLVNIQVLLPNHGDGAYQLWLPSWPLVMKTWVKRCSSIMVQLKRSFLKEKSMSTFTKQNHSCPIPASLFLEYLVSLHLVKVEKKPAGEFVKLV